MSTYKYKRHSRAICYVWTQYVCRSHFMTDKSFTRSVSTQISLVFSFVMQSNPSHKSSSLVCPFYASNSFNFQHNINKRSPSLQCSPFMTAGLSCSSLFWGFPKAMKDDNFLQISVVLKTEWCNIACLVQYGSPKHSAVWCCAWKAEIYNIANCNIAIIQIAIWHIISSLQYYK